MPIAACQKNKASQNGRLVGFGMELAISGCWLSRWSRWDCSCCRSRSLWPSYVVCDVSWFLWWLWCCCSDRPMCCSVQKSRSVRCCWIDHRCSIAQSSSNPSTRVQIPSLVASSLCSSPLGVYRDKTEWTHGTATIVVKFRYLHSQWRGMAATPGGLAILGTVWPWELASVFNKLHPLITRAPGK